MAISRIPEAANVLLLRQQRLDLGVLSMRHFVVFSLLANEHLVVFELSKGRSVYRGEEGAEMISVDERLNDWALVNIRKGCSVYL